MNPIDISENITRYANRITKPVAPGFSPADIALIIPLACESGVMLINKQSKPYEVKLMVDGEPLKTIQLGGFEVKMETFDL